MHRVVITGAGAIAAPGPDAPAIWSAMAAGTGAIGPVTNFPPDAITVAIAAQVQGFDPLRHFDEKRLASLDRVTQFALVAAREAVMQSQLQFSATVKERCAVVIGTGVGGELSRDEQSRRLYGEHKQRVHPLAIVRVMSSAPASQVSMEFGAQGPTFGVTSACASSNHALAQALMLVRSGAVDVAIAGGSEACLSVGLIKAWEALRVLADDTCRPFSAHRRGLVLGEGAGIFVLESADHAARRGATVLAELAGAGMTADAGDLVLPSPQGAASAMARALSDAGLRPEEIDYVNAHGTGTAANDVTESAALHQVFGAYAHQVAVSSTKAMHGHALGASGAIELIAVLGALRHGIVPPTINYLERDAACDLDYVPNVPRHREVRAALSNSFAFGGLNAVLALRRAP